jgi:hypothetical protein
VTLGIAGFGALASLTPYRPVFITIAVAALAASYMMTYRSRWRQLRAIGVRAYRPQLHEAGVVADHDRGRDAGAVSNLQRVARVEEIA